jgi:hypothetical protein
MLERFLFRVVARTYETCMVLGRLQLARAGRARELKGRAICNLVSGWGWGWRLPPHFDYNEIYVMAQLGVSQSQPRFSGKQYKVSRLAQSTIKPASYSMLGSPTRPSQHKVHEWVAG